MRRDESYAKRMPSRGDVVLGDGWVDMRTLERLKLVHRSRRDL
jgi:hypothetical protein